MIQGRYLLTKVIHLCRDSINRVPTVLRTRLKGQEGFSKVRFSRLYKNDRFLRHERNHSMIYAIVIILFRRSKVLLKSVDHILSLLSPPSPWRLPPTVMVPSYHLTVSHQSNISQRLFSSLPSCKTITTSTGPFFNTEYQILWKTVNPKVYRLFS